MKTQFAIIIAMSCWSLSYGQQPASKDSTQIEQLSKEWLANLYDYGIMATEDSILITAEVQEVLANESLQELLYPETYTWEMAVKLLEKMQLKMSFWYFINLYSDDPELAMKSVLYYDHLFEVDHLLLASFYTYAFADPHACTLEDGKPVISRPDIIEEKLYIVREMVAKVAQYRIATGTED